LEASPEMPDTRPRPEEERRRALDLLAGSRRFLLCGHVRPDGDCLGAQSALSAVLERLGREVWIVNTDPLPPTLDFLARDATFRVFDGGALPQHDVAVMLDFCEIERTGPMKPALLAAGSRKLVVDHHLFHGTPWWDEAYVDPTASATGLLVRRIARELGVALDERIARGVYTSLVTDTGWFKYSNTDAETFATASELVVAGVEPARMYGAIYQRNSRSQPLGLARALSRLEYVADGKIAVVDLPQAQAGEIDLPDGDDLLDLLRAVGKVEVVLYLREIKDGTVKLSARSKTDYDVNRLARGFGGGGHAKASGATLPGPIAEARRRLVEAAVAQLEGKPLAG
jgi:phosphoesterase RecJ-like protein